MPTPAPLWSAWALSERPEVVRQIHLAYARSGADVLTTATFRATGRMLARAGRNPRQAAALNRLAVRLAGEARELAGRPRLRVAGSIAPLEDCYRPDLTPPYPVAVREHREQARALASVGADLLLIETMPTAAEAAAALDAARETNLEAWVSFVVREDGRLLGGESLAEAVDRVEPLGPAAILVNCAAPPAITVALTRLTLLTDLPAGAYANVCTPDGAGGWTTVPALSPTAYAALAAAWVAAGARIVGGCCGTTPAHIAAVRARLDAARANAPNRGAGADQS